MQQVTSWNLVCDRFPIVAFVKLIAVFVYAFAIWPYKKKREAIAAFLKCGYRQIKKKKDYSRVFKTLL